jgi:D-alanyl-D-alanine carboxypeptidase
MGSEQAVAIERLMRKLIVLHRIRKALLVFAGVVTVCSTLRLLAAQSDDSWMVLPDSLDLYTSPSLEAPKARLKLHYPQIVKSTNAVRSTSSYDFLSFKHRGETYWIPEPVVLKMTDAPSSAVDLPIGMEEVSKQHPLWPDYRPSDLVSIPSQYCLNELSHKLRREAAGACMQMLEDARKAGLDIRIASSYRSFTNQRYLYLQATEKYGLDQTGVAKPGHSQHQLGTAIDVVGSDLKMLFKGAFGETPEGKWLSENAGKYGFTIPYRKDNMKSTGYKYEPWHLRYVGKSRGTAA